MLRNPTPVSVDKMMVEESRNVSIRLYIITPSWRRRQSLMMAADRQLLAPHVL